MNNIVELIADQSDCANDQPCIHGHRVETHAVYCHHGQWENSPRKCRRSWATGGEVKDEDCPGFQPNPEFKGALDPSALQFPLCTKCKGKKIIRLTTNLLATCPLCCGSGTEPQAMSLTQYEQDTLELGSVASAHSQQHEYYVRIAEDASEDDSIENLLHHDLIELRSCSVTKSGAYIYLLRLTGKGNAVMRRNWAKTKTKKR